MPVERGGKDQAMAAATASSHSAAGRGARRVARAMTIATITATASQANSVKRARQHMVEQRQLPEGQPGQRDVQGLLADVEPRPEREHEEQRAGDARDADPEVVPLADGDDDQQDQQRQRPGSPSPRDTGR